MNSSSPCHHHDLALDKQTITDGRMDVRTCFFLPAVDGGVAFSEPTDSWQFVLLTSSTEIHNHIVLRHHQLQSAHYEPDTYREAVVRRSIEKALNWSII